MRSINGWTRLLGFVVISTSIIFMGCGMKQVKPLDPSLTPENAATVIYRNYYKIKTIDGAKAKGFSAGFAKSASVLLPPGEHTFGLNYSDVKGIPYILSWGIKMKNITIECDLEAGKTYVFKSNQYGTYMGPLFSVVTMSNSIEPLPDGGLKAYLKNGHVTKAKWDKQLQEDAKAKAEAAKHFKQGQKFSKEEKFAEAIAAFEEASRLDPDNSEYKAAWALAMLDAQLQKGAGE